ncbi:MAG: Hsp20/alpha crystallin family protein [Planctomycetota bacterium]
MFTKWLDLTPNFKTFDEVHQELNQWLNQALDCHPESQCTSDRFPALQLKETPTDFQIDAFAPGMKKEQLNVNLQENILEISGKRDEEPVAENTNYLRKERFSGKFSRSIQLPKTANPEKIAASYKNGVLSIVIGKKPEATPKQIQIQTI